MTDDKKDYILNIRISRDTYEKLKTKAKDNRESLSHLVRSVIDDGLEIIDDVSNELFGKSPKKDDIQYYYDVELAHNTACSRCSKKLKKGAKAFVAETNLGKKRYVCNECKGK